MDTMLLHSYLQHQYCINLLLLTKRIRTKCLFYKLSILAFWGLLFVYLWAGGHHLVYSTVPDWMQTMGSVMSVVLILPSWGSAINMLLTMKGEWNQLQSNTLIKFMVLASTFYMLSTIKDQFKQLNL